LLAKGIFYNLPFFALLTLGAANIVLGQEAITNAIITGRVFDSTGSVVSRATVQLYSDPEGKTALAETTTNAVGEYTISTSAGAFVLSVGTDKFQTTKKQIRVSAGQQLSQDFSLELAAVSQSINVVAEGLYVRPTGTTGTKIDTPAWETPFTADTVTRELVDDQGDHTLEQVLQNVSSVQAADYDAGWGAKSYFVRGFDTNNLLFQDGVRLPQYAEIEPAMIDGFTVLKGAAAGLYGRIEPGGIINVTTLKPQPTAAYGLGLTYGPYGLARVQADATGPLYHSHNLLYRGIVAYEIANSYRDTVQTRHLTVSPALTWTPTANDRFDLRFEYKHWQDDNDQGMLLVPAVIDPASGNILANRIPDLPRSVYFGASGAYYNVRNRQETLTWTHKLGRNWTLKPMAVVSHMSQPGGSETGPTGWLNTPAAGFGSQNPTTATYYVGDPSAVGAANTFAEIDLTGRVSFLGMQHSLLASTEFNNQSSFYHMWPYGGNLPQTIDVYDPVYQPVSEFYTPPSSTPPTYAYTIHNRWYSGTVQDQVTIGKRLRILGGIRYDSATYKFDNYSSYPGGTGVTQGTDTKPQPRVGASYDLLPWLAAFGSYSESLGDSSAGSILYNGKNAKALTANQWEVGLKGHWLGNRLTGEVNYFDLKKQNILVDEPIATFHGSCTSPNSGSTCAIQVGQEGSRGVEVSLNGRISSFWNVVASYANILARVLPNTDGTSDSALPVGQRLLDIPPNSGSLWAYYHNTRGWGAGLGLVGAGERPVDQPSYQQNTTLVLPGYVQWNAVVSYRWELEKVEPTVQVRFDNITNVNAWQPGYGSYGVIPSQPFSVYGTFKLTLR
jgi:iron complex outermembrane receptor protein